jgi:hypothetical protein
LRQLCSHHNSKIDEDLEAANGAAAPDDGGER